ncbi:MAG: AMP-binding protein [Burkholderiales bacterium]
MTTTGPQRNVASLLARTARAWPSRPALATGTTIVADYARFAGRVARLGAAVGADGVVSGDRVAILARNHVAYLEALFAAWWAGLVAVPINAKLHRDELAWILADCGARWVFADREWARALAEEPPAPRPRIVPLDAIDKLIAAAPAATREPAPADLHDPAWLFYTSGTTGRPKGVEITHGNLVAMTRSFLADVEAVDPGDAILHAAPLSHGSGLYAVPHVARAALNVVPESGGFDAAEVASLIGAHDRSLLFAAPTMLKRLVRDHSMRDANFDRLKAVVCGGGPLYVEDAKEAHAALGPRLAQIYGQGESPMTITAMSRALVSDAIARGDDGRLGSVGVAQTGIEVVVDGATNAGDTGEVLVRGDTVMRGYWRNASATAAALAGGWLRTGDVGALDDDGFLTLKDRSKDLIISGGANIYPREVEEALLRDPALAEVAVVGRRNDEWGEEVVACVVPRVPPASDAERARLEAAFDRVCLASIARFKRPRAYVFLAELPKNATGKVLKTELRSLVASPAHPPDRQR